MAQYTVEKVGLNKFGFGTIHLVGGATLHAKGNWGFGIGKKAMPPCAVGDLIEGDIGAGQYAEIKNVRVVGKGEVPSTSSPSKKSGGNEFRTPDQIMRTTAVECAINNLDEVQTVEHITLFADELFDYIKRGKTVVNSNQMGDTPPDDDIPF